MDVVILLQDGGRKYEGVVFKLQSVKWAQESARSIVCILIKFMEVRGEDVMLLWLHGEYLLGTRMPLAFG